MQAGGGRWAAVHAGCLHAVVVDHLPRHSGRPAPALRLHDPDPPAALAVHGDLSGGGAVRTVERTAALHAYAVNFPMQKFFHAQSRVWVMMLISGATVAVHALLNWVVMASLRHGLVGAPWLATYRGGSSARRSWRMSWAGPSRRNGGFFCGRRSLASAASSRAPSHRQSWCGS